MQTFCTEGLTISENNTKYFKSDFKPRQSRRYTFISFLNVPLEKKEKQMDAYVKQYCTVHGVHYPFQKIDDIKYHIGTRVYRVSDIVEHLSKANHIFGRWVRIIYDGQPDRKRQSTEETDEIQLKEMETQQQQPTTNSDSPIMIKETPPSQMPEPPVVTESTKTNQPQQPVSPIITDETPELWN